MKHDDMRGEISSNPKLPGSFASSAIRHAQSPIINLPANLLAVKTGIPLYHRLASTIREMVDNDVLRPGDQLPPEDHIAAHFNISRGTVRQAIDGLVRARILVKEHGIGTFVNAGFKEPDREQRGSVQITMRPHLAEPQLRPRARSRHRKAPREMDRKSEGTTTQLHNSAAAVRFVTLIELANELNVSMSQAYALVRSGEIKGIQVGGRREWRIERAVIEHYVQNSSSH